MRTWQGRHISATLLYSRAGIAQQIWLASNTGSLLVDAGDGALRDVISNGFDPKTLNGIIFTHGHFDHISGLYALLGFMRMVGRRAVLTIYAPQGCREVSPIIKQFTTDYADSLPFGIQYREINAEQTFDIAGMSIRAYAVEHCGSIEGQDVLERIPAMGYRISYRGEIIAITGDTGLCYTVKQLVMGADLAIIEAVYEKTEDMSEEILQTVHLSVDKAVEIGKLAKEYILVHQGSWFKE
jgi:ribonuclease BN (tRNA processing enzyme)